MSDDLISRQAAISAISYSEVAYYPGDTDSECLRRDSDVKQAIMGVPSAQQERKTGEWIVQDDGWDGVYYECSCCKEAFTLIDGTPSENLYNFCPNCGADMRGEEDETD